MRKTIALLAILSLMLIGLAVPVAADQDARPFKAVFSGELYWTPDEPCGDPPVRTNFDVVGNATHMGRTTMAGSHCTPAGVDYGPSVLTFTAANGDVIEFEYGGTCEPWFDLEVGEILTCTAEMQVLSGTGRFTDVTFEGSGMLWIEWLGIESPTMPAWWVYTGTIGY